MRHLLLLGILILPIAANDLNGLGFLAGAWRGASGKSEVEEHWMEARGDAMVGMYRVLTAGRTRMTELCLIEQGAEGPVLFIRHFSPGLVAREEKDAPMRFSLERSEPRKATFRQQGTETRLIYERPDDDTLTVTLVKTADGKEARIAFEYRRVKAQ